MAFLTAGWIKKLCPTLMKYTVRKPQPRAALPKLPAVGTYWRHKIDPEQVYLRIDDATGAAMLNNRVEPDRFYSLDTRGNIVYTCTNADDIELLKVVSAIRDEQVILEVLT